MFSTSSSSNTKTLFNDQFNTLVEGMANAAGVAVKDVIVTRIIYSSVNISTNVAVADPVGSDGFNNAKNNLFNYINSYSTNNLAGSVVVDSTSGTTNTGGDDDNNTTLIVAIVVPIVVVRKYFVI